MTGAGRLLVVCGLAIMATGFLLLFAPKVPFIGKLSGEFHLNFNQ